jgi:hypothetical protein
MLGEAYELNNAARGSQVVSAGCLFVGWLSRDAEWWKNPF